MDDLDFQLRQLVREAQQYPAQSSERWKVLNRFVIKIQRSEKLKKFTEWQDYPNFEEIYEEAKAKTFVEICNNIDGYHPEYKVMAWVNQILKWRFKDVLRQARNRSQVLSLDELDSLNSNSEIIASKELSRAKDEINEKLIIQSNHESESTLLKEFVRRDPERVLQNTYIGEDKNANLQAVLLMRLNEEKWEEISKQLGHPISRLSELYQRSIKKRKIIDYFRNHLQ